MDAQHHWNLIQTFGGQTVYPKPVLWHFMDSALVA